MKYRKTFGALLALFSVLLGMSASHPALAEEQLAKGQYDPMHTLQCLNMAIVSVKTVISTQDRIVLDQEYRNIISNLRFARIKNDQPLVNLHKRLLDVCTENKLSDEEAKRFDEKYERRQKNALVSTLSGIRTYGGTMLSFLGSLFTQGVSAYFGYRDTKARIQEELGDALWHLEKEKITRFNTLQKELFDASWNLLQKYRLDDKYLLSQEDLPDYEQALQEQEPKNAIEIFRDLKEAFAVYPPFWAHYGLVAYRAGDHATALKCFDEFDKVWLPVLRRDPYKAQVAKCRLMIEKNPSKERVLALLKDVESNSNRHDWSTNLFIGVLYYAADEKEKGIDYVKKNIRYKDETEISSVVYKSMQEGKLDMATLPGEITAALKNAVPKTVAVSKDVEKKNQIVEQAPKQTKSEVKKGQWNGELDEVDVKILVTPFSKDRKGLQYASLRYPVRVKNVQSGLNIPSEETIVLLHDSYSSIIAFGKRGIYGNCGYGPTFVSWTVFAKDNEKIHWHFVSYLWIANKKFSFMSEYSQKYVCTLLTNFRDYLRDKYL